MAKERLGIFFIPPQLSDAENYFKKGQYCQALNLVNLLIDNIAKPSDDEIEGTRLSKEKINENYCYESYLEALNPEWFKLRASIYKQLNRLDEEIEDLKILISIDQIIYKENKHAIQRALSNHIRIYEIYTRDLSKCLH